jgi:hypothetical protein
MRSNGPLANKEVAIGGHRWPWVAMGGHGVAMGGHGVAESGRLVRRMSHRVDPAAIAEEARTVRLDAVLGPPRRSVPVGDSSTPESRTLTPLIMVRIQVDRAALCLLQGLAGISTNPGCRLIFSHILAKGPLANLHSALAGAEGASSAAPIFEEEILQLPSIGSDGRTVQIASVGKSLTFGHLALIDGRSRGAQVVAETELVCYAISIEALRDLGRSHPTIYVKILMNIIRDLADTLRFSNETIRGHLLLE